MKNETPAKGGLHYYMKEDEWKTKLLLKEDYIII